MFRKPPVAVGHALQDLRPDPMVARIVHGGDPEAQDVGAVLRHHVLRRDGVADALRHLHALRVEREPVRDDRPIGRPSHRAAALQHRGMEPAAMLVGALQIHVRDPVRRPVHPVAQHESVGGPAVEPDVEDVEHLLPLRRIVAVAQEPRLGPRHVPRIRALRLERGDDAGIDGRVVQQEIAIRRLRTDSREAGQRHAPGPLPRQHPVGPVLDHRVQPVAPRSSASTPPARRWRSAPARAPSRRTRPARRRPSGRWHANHCGVLR